MEMCFRAVLILVFYYIKVDICTGIMFFGLWIKMFVSEGGERRMCSVCAMSAYA